MADLLFVLCAIAASLLFCLILLGCTVGSYMAKRAQDQVFLAMLRSLQGGCQDG